METDVNNDRPIGYDGYAGSPKIVSDKGLEMIRFPLPSYRSKVRNLGHPIRLAGRKGKRLRGKSRPQ